MNPTTDTDREAPLAGRLLSLDVFRGITVAGMILVNNPGSWSAIYPPLEHAEWHGWTPTDLIFPFFLFIVGVSITLAFARRVERGGGRGDLVRKVVRRTLVIFALGLVLAGFPHYDADGHLSVYDLSVIRIPGVLQRIAICYFFASLVFLFTRVRTQAAVAAALLLAYWALMRLVPVPGFGAGDLSMEGNLAAYVDRAVFGRHTWKPLYDPEGILSTVPAIATTLAGVLTGHWLRSPRERLDKAAGMFVAGAACVVAGWAWHSWFPINKALWTSSYVLFTAGMALQLLAVCYWLLDIKDYTRWAKPFRIFGTNALALFFLTDVFERLITVVRFTRADGSRVALKTLVYQTLFASWAAPVNASLLYALCYVLLWLGLMTILYRRRIFIKV